MHFTSAVALGAAALTLAACDSGKGVSMGPNELSARIAAPATEVQIGMQVAFTGSVNGSARWSVNGITGGDPSVGTISPAGVYTAPAEVPLENPVEIGLQSAGNPADAATVSLVVVPAPRAGIWVVHGPRVVDVRRTDSITLVVHTGPTITRVDLAPRSGSAARPFRRLFGQLHQINVAAPDALAGYASGDLHNFIGFIDYYAGAVREMRGNAFINVHDGTVSATAVTRLADDAQMTDFMLNLRVGAFTGATGVDYQSAARRLYELLPDDFDFLAVIQPVNFYQNRHFALVRNGVAGIGLPTVDGGAAYGSAARLQGIVHYPIDDFFDLGETAASHEIGHRWINFLTRTPLGTGSPHWPRSSLAAGVMGFGAAGAQGTQWPWAIVPYADGTYAIVPAEDTGSFKDLDLYLMGLASKDEVKPHVVFNNPPASGQASPGAPLGPMTTVTIDDVIAAHGERTPAYPNAPQVFRIGTIVLSYNRLLTSTELAFFSHLAARGEATTPLRFTSGFVSGTTKPFFIATRGRGRLVTRMR